MEVRKIDSPYIETKYKELTLWSSIYDRWACCIRERVRPTLPVSGRIDWCLTVILTIRTWAVWDRNQWLSIILPILYSVCWVADLFIMVRLINSTTCT